MSLALQKYNRYDRLLFFLILSMALGDYGGYLTAPRILAIILFPAFISKVRYCRVYMKKYFTFFVLFYIFCAISLLWTPDLEEGVKEMAYYLLHIVLFCEILVFSRFANRPLNTISWGWVFAVGATLLVAIWELTTGNHLALSFYQEKDIVGYIGGARVEVPFAAATFYNYNGYIVFLCYALPFLFYSLRRNKDSFKYVVFIFILLLIAVGVMLVNASRGGLLALLVMIVVLLFTTKRSTLKSIIFISGALIVVFWLLPKMDTLFVLLSSKTEDVGSYSDEPRLLIWSTALKVAANYLFMGTGIGGMLTAMKDYAPNVLPLTHNIYLEFFLQYGFVFWGWVLVYMVRLLMKGYYSKNGNIKILLYTAMIAMPAYGIIDSAYLLSPSLYIFLACLSAFAYIESFNSKGCGGGLMMRNIQK